MEQTSASARPAHTTEKYSSKDARRVAALFSKLDSDLNAEREIALRTLEARLDLTHFMSIVRFAAYSLGYSTKTTTKWLRQWLDDADPIASMIESLFVSMRQKNVRWSDILAELPMSNLLAGQTVQCAPLVASTA